jgi:glycosyltransferase involved in cell wall biosynthesis
VNGVAGVLLCALARHGVEIDVYTGVPRQVIPEELLHTAGLNFLCQCSDWDWNRWYSRTHLTQFVTGHAAAARTQGRLTREIARRHAERPYDFLYQFSQIELLAVRVFEATLPPIVLHPETHAAGELQWLRAEAALADRCGPRARNRTIRAIMVARAILQRRDIRRARVVIAISPRFGQHLIEDYGVANERVATVPNPVVARDRVMDDDGTTTAPLHLAFVSRLAVRKGVEMIVALSHDLDDLAGQVTIEVVGSPSLWSNYLPLLDDLNPRIARHLGYQDRSGMDALYRRSAALLAPSRFEPFGLTVGEALTYGLPVIASDEVGAVADVDRRVCHLFPAGDQQAFGETVRAVVDAARNYSTELRNLARTEALRLFDPVVVSRQIIEVLEAARVPRGPIAPGRRD